jgi:hypothetical protein
MSGIALLPGGFKPPTLGHFSLARDLATNSFDLAKVDGERLDVAEKPEDIKVDKVLVLIGVKERNGITSKESKRIWDIYKKHLPSNVEIIETGTNPMNYSKDSVVKKNPDTQYYAIVGLRSSEDLPDLGRATTYTNYPNVEVLPVLGKYTEVRASSLRDAILNGNEKEIKKFLPQELSDKELQTVIEIIKGSIMREQIEAKMSDAIGRVFDSFATVEEGSSGAPIAAMSAIPSDERARLIHLYHDLKDQIPDGFRIEFMQNKIEISIKHEGEISYDYTPYMGSMLEYMLDQGMKILPLPEVKIRKDLAEASDIFGKTAYYDPGKKEIVLYVSGRHPKDVLRSFAHEMVHHKQNLENRLENIQTTNTNEDGDLQKLEEEAYLLGNMMFRTWEDKVKNENA